MVLLGAYTSSFAFLTQSSWRWRNNDGTETSATWKAAQNTSTTYTSTNEVLRLRIEIYNTNDDTTSVEDSLQYTTTPGDKASWKNITKNDISKAFILAGSNGFIAQDEPTTTQITGNSYAFVPGKMMTDSPVAKNIAIPSSNRSEFEWAIKGTSNTLPNTTYYFKHWGSTSNSLPPGATYPSLITSATLPVKLKDFSVKKEGSKVKLEWSTASEQNNDHFEVEKSADGRTWGNIAQVEGQGTSNETHSYSTYDNKPSASMNYYRIKQYDLDGKSTVSEVRSLKFDAGTNAVVTVSPNPTKGQVNFRLDNTSAKNVSLSLTNVNGKSVYRRIMKTVDAGTTYKLDLQQQPAPGLYILNIQADGISESIKVVIQ